MANRDLRRIDFCKSKSKLQVGVDLGTPLDVVGLIGLASLGCEPLVVHLRDTASGILSRVNQNSGAFENRLLTSIADSGFVIGTPTQFDLIPSPTVAGLLASPVPVTAGAVQVLPATVPTSLFNWGVGGAAITRTQDGIAVNLASDTAAFNLALWRGFGSLASGGNFYVEFPTGSGQEWTGSVNVRANRRYVPFLSLPHVPSLQPLGITFNSIDGYRIVPLSPFIGVKQVGSCVARVYSLQVAPSLLTCNGNVPLTPFGEPNGPSLTRTYCRHRFAAFDTPGLGGNIAQSFFVGKGDVRGYICVYADSSRVSSVSISPGSALGSTGVSVPTITTTPAGSFPAPSAGWNFDTIYQFDVAGTEASYAVSITSPAGTITIDTFVPWSGTAHVRTFEMYADAHAAGNPNLACS